VSYYSKKYNSSGMSISTSVIIIIICFALIFAMIFGLNSCSASTWNDGICPDCEVRYELRGASRGLKYYSCPECGQEVERY
jgi:hypothetical protein